MAKRKRRRQKEQAVVIAVKDGRLCLIKSNGGKRWILPKGSLRRGDTTEQVALQEAWEEAGLVGQLLRPAVGTYLDNDTEPGIVTTAFLMHVTHVANVWPEANRKRRWVDPQRALALLHSPQLRNAVRDTLKQRTTRSSCKSRRPRRTRRQHESRQFVRLFEKLLRTQTFNHVEEWSCSWSHSGGELEFSVNIKSADASDSSSPPQSVTHSKSGAANGNGAANGKPADCANEDPDNRVA